MESQFNMPEKSTRESHLYELIVSVTLLLVFILVIITGVMSFIRLDHIINTINKGNRPDRKLLLVKEISGNLSEAESSVKSYSLTKSDNYLSRFYELTNITGNRFDELKKLVTPGDTMAVFIDTLSGLVEQKFAILDKLLEIQDEFRVQQAMDRVMQSINEQEKDTVRPVKIDTLIVPVMPKKDTIPSQPPKKENFFTRLFKKKERKPEVETDTVPLLDTILTPAFPESPPAPDLEKISSQVGKVRMEALVREKALRQEEWNLFMQDNQVMERIKKQVASMEALEAARLAFSSKNAEKKAAEVKFIIFTFGLASALLLILASLVIYRYVRKNYQYRQVMQDARERAEELSRAKERFLANMSHEIRTPMNIISGFTSQLIGSRLNPDQREQLGMMKKSTDHLLQILNDLLDLSRLQAGKMELAEISFSPSEIIRDMHQWLEPAAHEKNIEFASYATEGLPNYVLGDPLRVRQILFNLVGNAIKFTDTGKVTLKASPGGKADNKTIINFEVKDTGIGIAEADKARVFEEFEQGSGKIRRESTGAGLGLSITRRLVNLLGGEITVDSRPGKGSTFTVSIPFAETLTPPEPLPIDIPPAGDALKGLRVLVVDDEEYNLRLMTTILQKYGCTVTIARDGEESLALVDDRDFSLVLMDIRMPGISGTAAAREIKDRSAVRGSFLPVIAVSAAMTSNDLDIFFKSGMDGFIPKPFEETQLVRTILSVISRQGQPLAHQSNPVPGGKKTSQPFPQGDLPVYDLTPLKQASGGDMKFFREMVDLFLRNTSEGLTSLSAYIDNEEWLKAADMAHKISSPCRHLKADRLYGLLKEIEEGLGKGKKLIAVEDILSRARKEFEMIRNSIMTGNELK
jgi:signal transduction histidine kinase/DNA-binding NarL/FixJ family response regulator/HPt (histidine-containing phosphotransfer) domain-containing protein